VIRPLAEAAEDAARLWLARWLADRGQAGELRQRADAGDDHALAELAEWLAAHDRLDELYELISAEEGRAAQLLACWRTRLGDLDVVRVRAGPGDDDAGRRLAHRPARRARSANCGSAQTSATSTPGSYWRIADLPRFPDLAWRSGRRAPEQPPRSATFPGGSIAHNAADMNETRVAASSRRWPPDTDVLRGQGDQHESRKHLLQVGGGCSSHPPTAA
jgi:hypothetical protein